MTADVVIVLKNAVLGISAATHVLVAVNPSPLCCFMKEPVQTSLFEPVFLYRY